MSAINIFIPTGFRLIASIENYENPKLELTINLLRYNYILHDQYKL